jgi:hypothetical protein
MKRLPVVSTEYVAVRLAATADPTDAAVSIALMPTATAEPGPDDWGTATWEPPTSTGIYVAKVLVGPTGTLNPTVGTWWPWIRVEASPEDMQRPATETLEIY